MITSRLIGGLGNQMFQYAAARALALRVSTDLMLDTRAFIDYKVHSYGLDWFSIQADVIDNVSFTTLRHDSFLKRVGRRFGVGLGKNVYLEKGFSFDPAVLLLKDGACLEGYWQSERYFADFSDQIRADLTVITPPNDENLSWLERIRSGTSISIHVRRGDYVTNPSANTVHGLCDLDYYRRAAAYVAGKLEGEAKFYVFSDDPEWVRENLELPYEMHYVNHNDASRNYEDLRLMSNCSHHIIANSSFSWWGAWLNPSSSKIVVAPKKWFRDESVDTCDLIPSTWIRL